MIQGFPPNKKGDYKMCATMEEFEILTLELKDMENEVSELKKKIDKAKTEIQSYMKKRKTEKLYSKEADLIAYYRKVGTSRFNKDLFISDKGKEAYKKYQKTTEMYKFNYLKGNQLQA